MRLLLENLIYFFNNLIVLATDFILTNLFSSPIIRIVTYFDVSKSVSLSVQSLINSKDNTHIDTGLLLAKKITTQI